MTGNLAEALAPRAADGPSFEIWFAVLGDAATGRALWLRRSHLRTAGGRHGSVVWASLYDAAAPERHVSATRFFNGKSPEDPLPSQLFGVRRLDGTVDTERGPMKWALDWQPDLPPHRMGPRWLADSPFIKTRTIVAAPRATFRGTVALGDETLLFEQARGLVYHIWGTRRAWDLRWIYVPYFDGDTEGWAAEFVAVRPGRTSPWLSWATLTRDGELMCTDGLWQMVRGSVRGTLPEIQLRALGPDFTVDVRATLDWQQQSSYVYRDPGGRPNYIAHSDTSAINVTLQRGGDTRRLVSLRNAAVEFHGPAPWGSANGHDPYETLFTR